MCVCGGVGWGGGTGLPTGRRSTRKGPKPSDTLENTLQAGSGKGPLALRL